MQKIASLNGDQSCAGRPPKCDVDDNWTRFFFDEKVTEDCHALDMAPGK